MSIKILKLKVKTKSNLSLESPANFIGDVKCDVT